MFRFLNSSFAFFIQVALVIGAVLVFSYFDPLGIFATRATLKNTPVSERSIREIGQLITAEYYGEVIASLPEEARAQAAERVSTFEEDVEELHTDFIEAIDDLRLDTLRKNSKVIYRSFAEENPSLVENELFPEYLYFLKRRVDGKEYRSKDVGKFLDQGEREGFLKKLYTKKDKEKYRDLSRSGINITDFVDEFERETQEQTRKELKKSRLVLLGRGSVKAGFNFGTFTEENFDYRTAMGRRTIHFIGLKPSILSATINPWFIPEEGVEGFEIMIATGKAKRDYELVGRVKQICLNKLRQQAMDRDILGRAESNARDNLKAFFSLLIEADIDEVFFHTNVLDYSLSTLLDDNILRDAELLTLDTVLARALRDTTTMDNPTQETIAFLDVLRTSTAPRLDELGRQIGGSIEIFQNVQSDSLHRFMALLYEIGEDEILSLAEQATLRRRADSTSTYEVPDSLWYPFTFDIRGDSAEVAADSSQNRDAVLMRKQGDFASMMAALRGRIDHLEERFDSTLVDAADATRDTTLLIINNDSLAIQQWFDDFN